MQSPKETACREYPIATTITKYGIATESASKGLGRLLQNSPKPTEKIKPHKIFLED